MIAQLPDGFEVEINLRKYQINDNSLAICIPGNIIKIDLSSLNSQRE